MEVDPYETLKTLLSNERIIPPLMKWKTVSTIEYRKIYEESIRDSYSFWEREALKLSWSRKWSRVVEGQPPNTKWFTGGYINAYYNIIGKHRNTWIWSKPAFIWENEEGDSRIITYSELDRLASRIASSLRSLGVKPGDWVLAYISPSIEALAFLLASIKIGAPFETVFTGFGYYELAKRIRDVNPNILLATSGFTRRGKLVDTLSTVRKAVELSGFKNPVVVIENPGTPPLRDSELSLQELLGYSSGSIEDYTAPSEHPLFGLHSGYSDEYSQIVYPTGGFLVQVYSTSQWIGLRPRDTYFCTVWPGWITGVSYVVFGPLMIGSTIVLYEGGPDYPSWDRWWRIIEDYAVTLFLTTSSALRILRKQGDQYVTSRNLDTLKAILVTAEPLEPDTWYWTYRVVGTGKTPVIDSKPDGYTGRIPVVNLYIQSEIGTFVTGNLVNYTFPPIAPGSAGTPIPGFNVGVVDSEGRELTESIGELVVRNPWPAMPIKYPVEYREKWKNGYYRTGDYAYITRDGYVYVLGRLDNIAKISGYRVSPGAIVKALRELLGIETRIYRVKDPERFESFILEYKGPVTPEEVKSTIRRAIGGIVEPKQIIKEE